VRFFAQARDAAGCRETRVDGSTVAEVLDAAVARCGPALASVIATSAVWVNGDQAGPADTVGDDDEVAVLPPVSGG